MRLHKMALALVLASTLGVGSASAQQSTSNEQGTLIPPALEQPDSGVLRISHDQSIVYASDDAAPPDPSGKLDSGAMGEGDSGDYTGDYYDYSGSDRGYLIDGHRLPGCCTGDPWKLFDGCFVEKHGLDIGGWMAQSYFWNPDNPLDRFNGPVTFNDRSNEYQLNQFYTYFSRPTDTGGCGWDLGGRIDVLYGSDWRFTPAVGLELHKDGSLNWNQSQRFYGLALPQMYGEVALNDLVVKLGHFYTIIGYEVVTAPDNFFSTHAYTMQYGEPFTHTGALGTYTYSDRLTLMGGIHLGWDAFADPDPNNNPGYLGGFTFTPNDRTSLAWACTVSNEGAPGGGFATRYMQSVVLSYKVGERLTNVVQTDYGHQAAAGAGSAQWYGLNCYSFFDINDCWAAGMRSEWFRDSDGFRVAGFGSAYPNRGWGGSGYAGDFYEISLGLNYKPRPNLIFRNELRFDWYSGADGTNNNGGGGRPYDFGTDSSQTMLGTNVIFTY